MFRCVLHFPLSTHFFFLFPRELTDNLLSISDEACFLLWRKKQYAIEHRPTSGLLPLLEYDLEARHEISQNSAR